MSDLVALGCLPRSAIPVISLQRQGAGPGYAQSSVENKDRTDEADKFENENQKHTSNVKAPRDGAQMEVDEETKGPGRNEAQFIDTMGLPAELFDASLDRDLTQGELKAIVAAFAEEESGDEADQSQNADTPIEDAGPNAFGGRKK